MTGNGFGFGFEPIGFDKAKLIEAIARLDLSGMLLTSPENVFYTTGFPSLPDAGNPIIHTLENQYPFASFVDRDGKVSLVCWLVASLNVSFGADEVLGYLDNAGALDTLGRLLADRVTGRVGVEKSCPLYALRCLEEAGKDPRGVVAVDDELLNLRVVKSPGEIARLEQSLGIVEETVEELYGVLELGMSRLELVREARQRMIAKGATGIGHITTSFGASNPEVALPEKLQADHLVTLDLGATYEGYRSDNRRYAFTGEVPAELRTVHQVMVGIVDEVGKALVPGASEASVFERGVELFKAQNLDPYFMHVGHHIGLSTEERWITANSQAVVEPGMVVNVELYTPVEGIDFVGDEETFVVEESGSRRISQLPREIRVAANGRARP